MHIAASGALYFNEAGKAVPFLCQWLLQVASGNPEPDSIEDTYRIVPCGARVRPLAGYPIVNGEPTATVCDYGHDHLPLEDAWARDAMVEEAERRSYAF